MSGLIAGVRVDMGLLELRLRDEFEERIRALHAELSSDLRAGLEGVMAHLRGLSESVEAAQSKRAARASGVPTIATDIGASYRGIVDRIDADLSRMHVRVDALERSLQRLVAG